MMRRFLYWLSGKLPCRLIKSGDAPYLERYYVGKWFGVTVYLHRFVGADGDRHVHDHPWHHSAAWVLAGGYVEERLQHFDLRAGGWVCRLRDIKRGRVNIIRGATFHRIVRVEPETWTLFMHGSRGKGWGFLEHTNTADNIGVLYHQPYNTAAFKDWHRSAPAGVDVGREVYAGVA